MKISEFLLGRTKLPLLEKGLDAYALRQKSISNNISNIDVAGYKRTEVSFEDDLKAALNKQGVQGYRTHPKHLPVGRPRLEDVKPVAYIPKDSSIASGLNNVDIDHEMAELAKNQIRYNYASRLAQKSFNGLRAAIRGQSV